LVCVLDNFFEKIEKFRNYKFFEHKNFYFRKLDIFSKFFSKSKFPTKFSNFLEAPHKTHPIPVQIKKQKIFWGWNFHIKRFYDFFILKKRKINFSEKEKKIAVIWLCAWFRIFYLGNIPAPCWIPAANLDKGDEEKKRPIGTKEFPMFFWFFFSSSLFCHWWLFFDVLGKNIEFFENYLIFEKKKFNFENGMFCKKVVSTHFYDLFFNVFMRFLQKCVIYQ
jgi:hypothetical protein